MASSSSATLISYAKPSQDQVFINFRGAELRYNFVSHLKKGLKRNGINAFIDTDEDMGQELNVLLDRIQNSRIALAIFSPRYTESDWCLKELAKMMDCRDQGKLLVIPIFYKVEPATVKKQRGEFGDKFRDLVESYDEETKTKWTEALKFVPILTGLVLNENSDEDELISRVVNEVKKALNNISRTSLNPPQGTTSLSLTVHQKKPESSCGIELRLNQLEEKLSLGFEETTRIIGVVGMPGIGKSTLVKKLYEKSKNGFLSHVLIPDIHETSKEHGLSYLSTILLEDLLKVKNPRFETVQAAHEDYKDQLLKTKALVILDNVSTKEQLVAILGKRDWIKQGSKIVIATNDKSLVHNFVDDIYEVPPLSYKDSLEHFTHYAFGDQSNTSSFSKLSKDFVHYTKGNPLALKVLGAELLGKDESLWYAKLEALSQHHKGRERNPKKIRAQSSSEMLQSVWKESYDALNQEQKDTLLDIACFRSLDKNHVASLLDSYDAKSTDARTEIEELVNKYLVTISSGKIEMYDSLHMFSKELGREATAPDAKGRRRLWDHHTIIDALDNNKGASSIRSIFLDLADVKMKRSFHSQAFVMMRNIRYIKIYNTCCPQECDRDIILNFPEGLQLPLNELRCLHWLRFPMKQLPPDFNPKNLVDLKLHYSEIERVWEGNKDASKIKWIDFGHSRKLSTLSGLAEAWNLQELNLEGCVALDTLPTDMENMKCLVYLNLKGCTSLKHLPDIDLVSLETLILSDCSKFKVFKVISENLEAIYLDGTAIKELPSSIRNLQRLVLLNMKGCKKLKTLPYSLGELKALQELILSGCSKLKSFPEVGDMKHLEILLLDETSIKEMPNIISLRRLSLSRNEKICHLPENISQFVQLKWLDIKYCNSLAYLPNLPPNLHCLDAHGCSSLKTIARPLAHAMATEHIHSTFIFTNCNKLEQAAKEEIALYAQKKCQLLPSALKLCKKDLVPDILFSTCYPGSEIPSWFSQEAIGSKMKFESPQHWNYKKLSGIALCAVVSLQNCQDQTRTEKKHANLLSVKFICKSVIGEEPCTEIEWKVGSWKQGNKVDTVELDHVFMGYSNCLHLKKHLEAKHSSQCAPIVAYLEFSVANDNNSEEARFEVLKSGFSFVFEPDENNPFWEANSVASPKDDQVSFEAKIINTSPRSNGCLMEKSNGVKNQQMTNGKPGESHS